MKIFLVYYKGSYLGGKAVVMARSRKEALSMVRNHEDTTLFKDIDIADEIDLDHWSAIAPKMIYHDNGDP